MRHLLAVLLCLMALAPVARADDAFLLKPGARVLFVGDSITHSGGYIQYVDAYLLTRFPQAKYELINVGLGSETVTGLSEPDHPWPRPDIHERFERALEKAKPDVVIACYGMNDGIYYPFAQERFEKYQAGFRKLIEKAKKAKATVALMTPPPFDPVPLAAKVRPATAEKFAWFAPYKDYDDVLTRYGEWLLTLRKEGFTVGDPHAMTMQHLAGARKDDPKYVVCGDGIHPNPTGQWLIAAALLQALKAPAEVDRAVIDTATKKATHGKVADLAIDGDTIRFTWESRVPLSADPRWDKRLNVKESLTEPFNRHTLTVSGAPQARYTLFHGDTKLGEVTREELAAGLDLTKFKELPTNQHAAEVLKTVQQYRQVLDPAWLTDVGHKRPDTPKGLPLEEAQKKAEPLQKKVREAAQPVTLTLKLVAK